MEGKRDISVAYDCGSAFIWSAARGPRLIGDHLTKRSRGIESTRRAPRRQDFSLIRERRGIDFRSILADRAKRRADSGRWISGIYRDFAARKPAERSLDSPEGKVARATFTRWRKPDHRFVSQCHDKGPEYCIARVCEQKAACPRAIFSRDSSRHAAANFHRREREKCMEKTFHPSQRLIMARLKMYISPLRELCCFN